MTEEPITGEELETVLRLLGVEDPARVVTVHIYGGMVEVVTFESVADESGAFTKPLAYGVWRRHIQRPQPAAA